MKVDACDHADSWNMDGEGMHRGASSMSENSCSEFKANPDCYPDIIGRCIKLMDDEEYIQIAAELTFEGGCVVDIALVTRNELNVRDIRERTDQIVEELQRLNDELLHIEEAEFNVTFMHPSENHPGDPIGLDAEGGIVSEEGTQDEAGTESCPICGASMDGAECTGCGYSADGWKGD
jgi:hypothetical protein